MEVVWNGVKTGRFLFTPIDVFTARSTLASWTHEVRFHECYIFQCVTLTETRISPAVAVETTTIFRVLGLAGSRARQPTVNRTGV
jgi:hypothetical protein